jgi:hypothetical protein
MKMTMAALVLVLALGASARASCTHNTAPTPDTRTGIGTIDYQLCHWEAVYNAMVAKLWAYFGVAPISLTIPAPMASDDGVPFPWVAMTSTTLQRVSCRVEGACTTPPVYSLETDTGSPMTLGGTLTCAKGAAAAAAVNVTGGGVIAAGHGFHFSTINSPTGDCTFAVLSVVAAETMP